MSKFVLFAVFVALQACLCMVEASPIANDSSGTLEWAKEAYGELKEKVVTVGGTLAEFVGMYYEEQVKPFTALYIQWAKDKASSLWDRVKEKVPKFGSN